MIAHVPARTASLFDEPLVEATRDLSGIPATIADNRSDWPGRTSATILLSGCDLSCPYCFSPEHVHRGRANMTISAITEHLLGRKDRLDGVVISGGEPTASPLLHALLESLSETGLPIKLDTNGTSPMVVRQLLADGLVSFISLDIKTTPERYDRLTRSRNVWERVERSIALVLESGIDHEFRTTCYPFAVSAADLPDIAQRLSGGRRYVLQQFISRRTLDPAASTVAPIAAAELNRAAIGCSVHLPTIVRGA